MSEVTNSQNHKLLRTLKSFAFETNGDFQNGLVDEIEVMKRYTFHESSEVPETTRQRSLSLGFMAIRQSTIHVKNKPGYSYELFYGSTRQTSVLPLNLYGQLNDDSRELLEDIDDDDFTEEIRTSYAIDDYDVPGPIQTESSYELSYDDEVIYSSSSTEISCDIFYTGESVTVPVQESYFDNNTIIVPQPILHESIASPSDRLVNELVFRAIINPFDIDDLTLNNFDIASARMRMIVDIMNHGIGTRRLYDI